MFLHLSNKQVKKRAMNRLSSSKCKPAVEPLQVSRELIWCLLSSCHESCNCPISLKDAKCTKLKKTTTTTCNFSPSLQLKGTSMKYRIDYLQLTSRESCLNW